MQAVVASAPGKVLITGGYLILEKPNAGIVLSTTARFYTIVKPLHEEVKSESWAWGWTDVKVNSPQLSRETDYKMSMNHFTLKLISSRDSSNPFVEQAVQYAVAAAKMSFAEKDKNDVFHRLLLQGIHITILGSNDFYSFRNQILALGLPLLPETLSTIPPFSSIALNSGSSNSTASGDNCKPEVAKTGLGSSAAMTASVVAAILHYLGVINLPILDSKLSEDNATNSGLDLVHVIAQNAHCMAQGKIGSGFDVSASVYGSQRYIRFSPTILSSAQIVAPSSKQLLDVVNNIINQNWDHEKTSFSLPPLMTLLLGEPGSGGSSTPSMVGAVKKWQNFDPLGSTDIFKRLAEANLMLEIQFKALSTFARVHWEIYKCVILNCSGHKPEKWRELVVDQLQESIVKTLIGAREAFLQIRSHMQKMGKAACVPIEPESQTQFLDSTMNLEGVLLAGVPGAGGYDAIFAITLGESNKAVIKTWSSAGVLPLLVSEDPHGVSLESGDPQVHQVSSAISSIQIN